MSLKHYKLGGRFAPKQKTLVNLCQFILDLKRDYDPFLEFGVGRSSCYLTQMLNPKEYIGVETWDPIIQQIEEICPDIKIVNTWEEIPHNKYKMLFVDSNVGAKAGKHAREKTVIYAMENDLVADNAILVCHDYNTYLKGGNEGVRWNNMIEKYNWKFVKKIDCRRPFAVYVKD